ncbi:MAG: ATP-binding protein [Bdellovibrionota bacterium]|jgi:predicted ATP-dependent endonuclease of OLD family
MKIASVKIKNFRSYKDEVTVDFENLTVFVGKNDSGKSTILEALDIFFNDGKGLGVTKLDENDINVENKKAEDGDNEIEITVVFKDLPEKLIIDATVETTLEKEHLLNGDKLEIIKRYKNAGTPKIWIRANHPTNPNCSDLLLKKQNELKKIIEDNNIDCSDRSVNSVMREAIWKHYEDDLKLDIKEIDVSKEDAKQIWEKINACLPAYSLFKSDRQNTDSDSEVQDPLKNAVNMIFKEDNIINKLDEIAKEVKERLEDVSSRTSKKLEDFDKKIAEELKPVIPPTDKLAWSSVFKSVSIFGDNIPINKRGSGVKRLILLSFFRAEAERQAQENKKTKNGVIYAIEEPETSQHTNNQKILIEALKSLSDKENIQVILTTHSAFIVKQLDKLDREKAAKDGAKQPDFSNIRIVNKKEDNKGRISKVEKSSLTYPSLNEVNFLAYDETSIEYHNELYGALESMYREYKEKKEDEKERSSFNSWLKNELEEAKVNDVELDKDYFNDLWKKQEKTTLPTYIRHMIHHPENKKNEEYTPNELKRSIELLREVLNMQKLKNDKERRICK